MGGKTKLYIEISKKETPKKDFIWHSYLANSRCAPPKVVPRVKPTIFPTPDESVLFIAKKVGFADFSAVEKNLRELSLNEK